MTNTNTEQTTDTKYLVFDFDGVIGDTYESKLNGLMKLHNWTREQTIANLKAKLNKQMYGSDKYSDPQIYAKELARKEEYKDYQLSDSNWYGIFNGFTEEISKLANTKLAIITNSAESYTNQVLQACNLKFEYIYGFDTHHSKIERIQMLAKNWDIDMDQMYFFTDAPTDLIELKDTIDSDKMFAVTWGFCEAEELLPHLSSPKLLLTKFTDIHKIFAA